MAFYGVTGSSKEVRSDCYAEVHETLNEAMKVATDFAHQDSTTYYVYEITAKPVFKATSTRTVVTEVIP